MATLQRQPCAGNLSVRSASWELGGVAETNTSISTINGQLRFTYTNESGKIVQLVKQLQQGDSSIAVGDALGVSPAKENSQGGFAQRVSKGGHAKALAAVDWSDTSQFTTRTFTDDNGVTRTAVLLPVTL